MQINNKLFAQSPGKAFTQRTSSKAPGDFKNTKIYHLTGDFTMIGNANAFADPYSVDGSNNGNMKFNKLLNDPVDIVNSSSADFGLPNGLGMACTKIIYAGLYWCGSSDNPADVLVRPRNLGNGLNKKKIKFKVPNAPSYVDITAAATDIYYGGAEAFNMYAAYSDVTELVQNAGLGTYAVGNIATPEGPNVAGAGYYGGWGLVIIYENKELPWRDITVFDGFGLIFTGSPELSLSGFNAVQNGEVKIKMGMMAGEGDRTMKGDYFNIQRLNTNNWTGLYHALNMDVNPNPGVTPNTSTNFFNSSILTGGNARNPNNVNNFGIDIAMFDLPNSGNVLIANNQTSTKFQFGTTGDIYNIFNITFGVDSYFSQLYSVNKSDDNITRNGTVKPGQTLNFSTAYYNTGTEALKDGLIEIPLSPNVNYVSSNIASGSGTVHWEGPFNGADPATTPGGKIVWNIGYIPLGTDPTAIAGQLKYQVRVTNDCTFLTTMVSSCGKTVSLSSQVSGVGLISGTKSSESTPCTPNSIGAFVLNIDADDAYTANCPKLSLDGSKIFLGCFSVIPRNNIAANYPVGTLFYTAAPGSANYENTIVTGDFPVDQSNKVIKYYAVMKSAAVDCFSLKLQTQMGGCMMISNPMIPTKLKPNN
ncbi:DUF11 domain-containing protein [Pedobacter nototheniae]|uniref:DUF11 domain-containing protein n=1 Tax=Pedobacter nototheniae TaxID=2488994 RepID=UPI00103E9AF0|nr:DUF11 domain-containing protein [Pedobacter nototheniae]